MGWPGNGFALSFEGTTLSTTLTDSGEGIMDLFVNGKESRLDLDPGTNTYTLIDSSVVKRFTVKLTRRTEVFDTGLFVLEAVKADGKIKPIKVSDREILFLGDSITAGFGLRGDTKDCDYRPETNAPMNSYASLTADQFGAERQIIAISGRGVIHNWNGNQAPVMPLQIDSALPDNGGKWDHNLFKPDVVVVALGTNDWSVINPGEEKFRQGYERMLRDLRVRFPGAQIITVNGPLLTGEKLLAVRHGIDGAMTALADPNISTLDLELAKTGQIWSCLSHPGRDSMKVMADKLGAFIENKTGWTYQDIVETSQNRD